MTEETKSRPLRLSDSERVFILVAGDLVCGAMATFISLALWAQLDWLGFTWEFVSARAIWFLFLPLIWLLLMVNLYDVRRAASYRETVRGVLLAGIAGLVLYVLLYFAYDQPGSLPRRGPVYFLILVVLLTLVWRWIYVRVFTAPAFTRRVLIVGAGDNGQTMLRIIRSMKPPPYEVVGLIDDDTRKHGVEFDSVPVLGGSHLLSTVIETERVTDVIVAILGPMDGVMFQTLLDAQEHGVEITRMPVAYEELLGRLPIQHLESDWLLRSFVDEVRVSRFYLLIKRIMDLLGAAFGLFVLAITLPWIALAILVESGRPVFFHQTRLGKGGKSYELVKLRTMIQDAEADGRAHWAQQQDPRTTAVGRFLRMAHLDEFPQFLNVMRGNMSLVGPRPERPELVAELQEEIPFYRARLLVEPGITGWAQINYGKGASIEGSAEKLEYDLFYIKHRSLLMEFVIILRTAGRVLGFKGV